MKYTFLGSSPDGPRTINFMGRQQFTVDVPTEVTNPELLDKLKTHKFFEGVSDNIKANVVDVEIEEPTIEPAVEVLTLPKKRGRPAKAN